MYHLVIFASPANTSYQYQPIGDNQYGAGIDNRTLGPSMIKHVLEKVGFKVQIINFVHRADERTLTQIFDKYVCKDTIVGVSTTFVNNPGEMPNIVFAKVLAEQRKKIGFKVLLGGPHPKIHEKYYKPEYMISGYAENQVIDLFNSIFNKGIARKLYNWNINACDHQWSDNDFIQPGETLPLENNRGCIFQCKFCRFELLGKKKGEYVRNMDLVRQELVDNYNKYGVTNYILTDDTFNDDLYKLGLWNEMLSSLPFKIRYGGYCRADLFHRFPQSARDCYESGLSGVNFGIETFHPYAAKAIGKSWSARHAKEFIPLLFNEIFKKNTMITMNFMVGLPGEAKESLETTMQWLEDNRHNYQRAYFYPLSISPIRAGDKAPTSEFDKQYEKYGYHFPNPDQYQDYWESPTMNFNIARKIASDWFRLNEKKNKTGMFDAFVYLNFTSFDQLLQKTQEDIVTNSEFKNRVNQFYRNYFAQVLQ